MSAPARPGRPSPGDRVFAALGSDGSVIKVIGMGVYAGDFPRPGSRTALGTAPAAEDVEWAKRTIEGFDKDRPQLDAQARAMYDRLIEEGQYTSEEADAGMAEAKVRLDAEEARPMDERVAELLARMDANPRIDLDDGQVAWGCECWWGPVEKYDQMTRGKTVVMVRIVRDANGMPLEVLEVEAEGAEQ